MWVHAPVVCAPLNWSCLTVCVCPRARAGQSANSLKVLNLSNCNIGEHGAVALAKALTANTSLERLLLRGNHIGVAGAAALAQMMLSNRSLRFLDVSNNNLRARGVVELESCAAVAEARVVVRTDGNFVREEIVGSVVHGVGLVVSAWGSFRLLGTPAAAANAVLYWSCVVYVVSVNLLYASSVLAHSFFLLRNVTEFFHVVDRAAIYVLIAGTYTPFMLVNLQVRARARRQPFLCVVSCCASPCAAPAHGPRYPRVCVVARALRRRPRRRIARHAAVPLAGADVVPAHGVVHRARH